MAFPLTNDSEVHDAVERLLTETRVDARRRDSPGATAPGISTRRSIQYVSPTPKLTYNGTITSFPFSVLTHPARPTNSVRPSDTPLDTP